AVACAGAFDLSDASATPGLSLLTSLAGGATSVAFRSRVACGRLPACDGAEPAGFLSGSFLFAVMCANTSLRKDRAACHFSGMSCSTRVGRSLTLLNIALLLG